MLAALLNKAKPPLLLCPRFQIPAAKPTWRRRQLKSNISEGGRKTRAEEERASPPLPNFHAAASERSCWTLVPNFPPPLFCSGRNFASLRFRNLISDIPFSDSPRLLFFLCCPNFIHCPLPSFFIILGNRRRRRRKEGRRPWESRALIS